MKYKKKVAIVIGLRRMISDFGANKVARTRGENFWRGVSLRKVAQISPYKFCSSQLSTTSLYISRTKTSRNVAQKDI